MKKKLILLLLVTSFLAAGADAQIQAKEETDPECLRVSITTDSDRLEKGRSVLFNVKVENTCDRSVTLYEPMFELDRITDDAQPRFDYGYGGRIIRSDKAKIDNSLKTLSGGEVMEFSVHSNEVRWKMRESSIDVFDDLFHFEKLVAGNYHLYCRASIVDSITGKVKHVESNRKGMMVVKPTDCEEARRIIDNASYEIKDEPRAKIEFVIHNGEADQKQTFDKRKNSVASFCGTRGFAEKCSFKPGGDNKGLGSIDVNVGGELFGVIYFAKNKPSPCSNPNNWDVY